MKALFVRLMKDESGATAIEYGLIAALIACAALGMKPVRAQDWPTKPIRIVTGFAAGGIGDLGARLLAEHITRTTGQQAVVENRTGAAGTLGMDVVAEGAETDSDAVELYQLGCEYAQGYVFGEPMSPEAARKLLQSEQLEPAR